MGSKTRESRARTVELVERAFAHWPRPTRVTEDVQGDSERDAIERDFGSAQRTALTTAQCSMMLIDGALLTPGAYFYFLPRLARDVLTESGTGFCLDFGSPTLERRC